MKHVFVETNWIVEYGAPEHVRPPKALELVERAEDGKVRLYLPSICLTEARHPIRKKFRPRATSDSLRSYLAWASKRGTLKAGDSEAVRRILDKYEGTVLAELDHLDDRREWLCEHPAIEAFPLSEKMLARAVELSLQNLDLKPFDQAILAVLYSCAPRSCAIRARRTSHSVSWTGIFSLGIKTGGQKSPCTLSTLTRECWYMATSQWRHLQRYGARPNCDSRG